MPDGSYERDALAWSERQADLLSRLASGERVNAEVDWHHVIEEVRDVGLSELRACGSLLRQALTHLLKIRAWPRSRSAAHWRDGAIAFLLDAEDRCAPSMRQRIDLDQLFARALHAVHATTDESGTARLLPDQCPFTLDGLLTTRPDVAGLVARLGRDPA